MRRSEVSAPLALRGTRTRCRRSAPPWAFETNSCDGSVRPKLAAERTESLRRERATRARPSAVRWTARRSYRSVTWSTRVPASLVPVELNSTSPGWDPSGSANVDPRRWAGLPGRVEPEAGVVAATGARVRDVDEVRCTAMLIGWTPCEDTVPPDTRRSAPSEWMRSTEI